MAIKTRSPSRPTTSNTLVMPASSPWRPRPFAEPEQADAPPVGLLFRFGDIAIGPRRGPASASPIIAGAQRAQGVLARNPRQEEVTSEVQGTLVNRVGIVNSKYVNLRADWSTNSEFLKALPFNTRMQVIREYPGGWYKISTENGDVGYVAKSYISIDLPEPGAKLHRVEGGELGYAINIAKAYYGADQDIGWGQDLRFYVNVLAHVNGITVPDTRDGWKSVGFKEGNTIWVPSVQFAKGLRGVVSSGSISYELADSLGIANALAQFDRKIRDYQIAIARSKKYMLASMAAHALDALGEALQVLIDMIIISVGVLAVTTAIGALVGSLAGGVGAGPGAYVGFEIGMFLLKWMGLAFLVTWFAGKMDRIAVAFGRFISTVWDADGDDALLEQGAIEFAEAVGVLVSTLVEGLVIYLGTKGLGTALSKIRGTLFHRAVGEQSLRSLQPERVPTSEQMQQGTILETAYNAETGAYEVISTPRAGNSAQGELVPYRSSSVPAALVKYATSRGAVRLYRNFDGHLVFVRPDGKLVLEHTIIRYNQRGSYGTSSFFQAHHGIQNHWGKSVINPWLQENIGTSLYSEGRAPSILLRDSRSDTPHGIITNRQSGRSGKISSRTYSDERSFMLEDMSKGDVPGRSAGSLLARSDAYFGEIYQQALDALVERGMSRGDAVVKLREIFGDWTP